ncbi:MAG: hypothetical protein AB8G05_22120 [Oligoflexales bacterium]
MLKKNIFILFICLLTSFESMAELNLQAIENYSELEEKAATAGFTVGFFIAGPTAAITAIGMSLPVAGLSMLALPLYYLGEGEKGKALQGMYIGPLSVIGFSGASGFLIGGLMTGAVTGILAGSGLKVIRMSYNAVTGQWNKREIAMTQ